VKFGHVVFEIGIRERTNYSLRTVQTDHNISHPYWSTLINMVIVTININNVHRGT